MLFFYVNLQPIMKDLSSNIVCGAIFRANPPMFHSFSIGRGIVFLQNIIYNHHQILSKINLFKINTYELFKIYFRKGAVFCPLLRDPLLAGGGGAVPKPIR